MKKSRILSLVFVLSMALSLLTLPCGALEPIDLYCRNAVLFNANYNEVLYDKAAYERAYPASITKVMTALLVLEAIEEGRLTLDTPVTAGETRLQDITASYSTAGIQLGEVLTVEQLMYCLMVHSDNDAANVLAAAADGTIEDFVARMNRRAGELGCRGTHFTNTAGMHNSEHYTTAYDIVLWMQAALKHEFFRTLIMTVSYTVPPTNKSDERFFYNTNGLISNWNYSGYVYNKCIGGKTGTTDEAGRCLAAAAEDDDTLLISVVLGSGPMDVPGEADKKQGQFRESKRLLEWGFANFHRVTITRDSEPVAKVAVTMSRQTDEVNLKPQGSITRTLPRDLDLDDIQTEITLYAQEVEAPVKEGEVMGAMKLSYEGTVYGVLDLVAVTSVERSELLYKKQQFLNFIHSSGVQLLAASALLLVGLVLLRMALSQRARGRRRTGAGSSRSRGNYRGTRR